MSDLHEYILLKERYDVTDNSMQHARHPNFARVIPSEQSVLGAGSCIRELEREK